MAESRCDAPRQISEMEDKVYAKFEKAEYTRCDSLRQAAEIIAEDKDEVAEVWRLPSKNMSDIMSDMEENYAEVRRVNRHKMDDMEEKAAEMSRDMRRKTAT